MDQNKQRQTTLSGFVKVSSMNSRSASNSPTPSSHKHARRDDSPKYSEPRKKKPPPPLILPVLPVSGTSNVSKDKIEKFLEKVSEKRNRKQRRNQQCFVCGEFGHLNSNC